MTNLERNPRESVRYPWLLGAYLGLLGVLLDVWLPVARSEQGPAADGDVLARFQTGQITLADYEQVLSRKLPQELVQIAKPGGREALLESLIRYDVLAQEAERRGYAKRHEVKEAGQRTAIDRMLVSLRVDPDSIPAEEVARVYKEREREFSRPRMRRATHIKLASEADAKKLVVELRGADREGFARVSRERNIDPRTRNQGGELGYFDEHGLTESGRETGVPKELVDAAFKLKKVGEISRAPIAHEGGWSVLMLTGEMAAASKPRLMIEGELREQLVKQREAQALDALVAELRTQLKPEVHPELVDAIELPPGEPLDIPEGFAAAPPDPRQPLVQVQPDNY
ncbi:MAG TPA: peptidyl-prolyl cis-trans isomerase [Polyangiales bacterium]|nr:peptidyl-prolyl cis-trans isomerase [Polyangiales bacterium]